MSTVTVSVQLTPKSRSRRRRRKKTTPTCSLGLETGFKALVGLAVGLAAVIGALLPWAVVLLLVGGPLWLLVRGRSRARRTAGDFEAD